MGTDILLRETAYEGLGYAGILERGMDRVVILLG
jgi:hypothetical protein